MKIGLRALLMILVLLVSFSLSTVKTDLRTALRILAPLVSLYFFFCVPCPQVALEKVFNFATTNIFETRVAGRMVADMCRAAAKVSALG